MRTYLWPLGCNSPFIFVSETVMGKIKSRFDLNRDLRAFVIRFELLEIRFEDLVIRFDLKFYAIRFDHTAIWQQIADTPASVKHTALLVSAR